MQIEHFFGGSALCEVDGKGRVALPRFVRDIVERRSGDSAVVIGAHGRDTCLTGYDRSFRKAVFTDAERRRIAGEASGGDEGAHHGRARRAFGLTEETEYDRKGRIVLPAMMRRMGRIEGLALFVGTGGDFEIWNPELAAESDDESLRALARYRLDDLNQDIKED
jgi:MraZ protein